MKRMYVLLAIFIIACIIFVVFTWPSHLAYDRKEYLAEYGQFTEVVIEQESTVNVSSLIKKYSEEYGADEKLALNIACAESCIRDELTNTVYLNPDAKNPTSTASGVFQFIHRTWNSMCEGDVFDAEDNIKCGTKILANGGVRHWEASRLAGFGGGWSRNPYHRFTISN